MEELYSGFAYHTCKKNPKLAAKNRTINIHSPLQNTWNRAFWSYGSARGKLASPHVKCSEGDGTRSSVRILSERSAPSRRI
ncbi:hypothetical protein EYF80_031516 [Liparis tanakae]|uniref:Uncharacterized protein n=1 Tax=Liparis tanakae TaxID=230148 RepID=A0A4Z2GXM1_9TELE|nr:hypothetical protein EYF80_031516 [Liparis tanakae]